MKIPNFEKTAFTDRSGNLTENWENNLQSLITQLQENLSDEGFVIPAQSTDNITKITKSQTLIYDSTTNELKININGTWKVIQTV